MWSERRKKSYIKNWQQNSLGREMAIDWENLKHFGYCDCGKLPSGHLQEGQMSQETASGVWGG